MTCRVGYVNWLRAFLPLSGGTLLSGHMWLVRHQRAMLHYRLAT